MSDGGTQCSNGTSRKRGRSVSSDEDPDELPVVRLQSTLKSLLRKHRVMVITGETGSGKTTQLPQLLLELERERWRAEPQRKRLGIVVTQPRRVAAMSVARRVAEERRSRLGDEVGYAVRFDDRTSDKTLIRYVTDGILLREFVFSPTLESFSTVMLDEAHERSIHTDTCFALLKAALVARPDLRVVVTSATLDVARFSAYLGDCPVFTVPGRVFDVDIYHSKTKQVMTATGPAVGARYVDDAVEVALRIHATQGPGHVLIFLTGQEEIDRACAALEQAAAKLLPPSKAGNGHLDEGHEERPISMRVLPLYGALPAEAQSAVFAPEPRGVRKVVVSTNIAETSVTVPGVRFVVDAGYVKQKAYNPERRMEALVVVPISRVAAQQRAGRAGRTAPGQCYRLYSKDCLAAMAPDSVPEIRRCNIANTVLQLKALGVSDVLRFDFLDPPDTEQVAQALRQLFFLGALDVDGNVTELGRRMNRLPLEPSLGRALLEASKLGCLQETLTVAACLSGEQLLRMPPSNANDGQSSSSGGGGSRSTSRGADPHDRFRDPSGDPLTYFNVYKAWEESNFSGEWAGRASVSIRALRTARNARRQLAQELARVEANDAGKNSSGYSGRGDRSGGQRGSSHGGSGSGSNMEKALRRALCAGFYTNAAERCAKDGVYRALPVPGTPELTLMHLHPSCALCRVSPTPPLVVYAELVRTARPCMRHVLAVEASWLDECRERLKDCDVNRLCGRELQGEMENDVEIEGESDVRGGAAALAAPPGAGLDAISAARARFFARKGRG